MDEVENLTSSPTLSVSKSQIAPHSAHKAVKKTIGMRRETSKTLSSIVRIAGRVDISPTVPFPFKRPNPQSCECHQQLVPCPGMKMSICVQKRPKQVSDHQKIAAEAITAVRNLKVERDALRDKLNDLEPLLDARHEHSHALALLGSVADALSTLESLVGAPNPTGCDGTDTWPLLSWGTQPQYVKYNVWTACY